MEDNAKTNFQKYKKIYVLGGVLLVLIISGFIGYSKGYRITNNFTLGKVGVVEMLIPRINTSIFIDESEKIVTTKDDELVKISFSPRRHSIIVAREGYFPWQKDFSVPSDSKLTFSPIFVTQNPTGEIITTSDPDYWKIQNLVVSNDPPTKQKPSVSKDGKVKMWMEDNAILVQVASTTKTVIQPDAVIRNIEFYKDRSDSIMFSTLNAVYVIEIDGGTSQNFMPIYKGQSPSFVRVDANSIYIKDGNTLMQVII